MKSLSIVICTHNRKDFLKLNLENLNQSTFDNFEVVIVDDGSSDKTDDFVNKFRSNYPIKYVYVEKVDGYTSPAKARNIGWRSTNSELISFTDPEVIVPVDYIEQCFNYHRSKPKSLTAIKPIMVDALTTTDFLSGRKNINDLFKLSFDYFFDEENTQIQKRKSWRDNHFSMMPREAIESVNGVNEQFNCWGFEGIDFIERMMKSGYKLHNFIEDNLYVYHLYHAVNRDMNKANNQRVKYGVKNCGLED